MLITDLAELQNWASIEGSEMGDYCSYLIQVYSRPECISPEFRTHLDNETYRMLKWFRDNFRIVDIESTHNYIHQHLEEK